MPRKLADLPDKFWLALAFLLRAGFALKLGNALYQADETGYDTGARAMAHTGSVLTASLLLNGKPLVMTPLAITFFSLCYRFLGDHPVAARLGQALLSTVLVWLMGRFVAELTGSKSSGKLALILSCVYPFFIYYGAVLLPETIYVLASTAGLWWLCSSLMDRGATVWKPIAAGLAFGLSGLCRGEGAYVSGVMLAMMLAAVIMRRWSWRAWLIVCLCWLVPIFGWMGRNKAASGHWVLDNHGGTSLLHGTVVFEQNEIDTKEAMEALHNLDWFRDNWNNPDEYEREKIYQKHALDYMREDPARTGRQCARKFVNFWRFYPRQDKRYNDIQGNNAAAGFGRWAMVAVSLLFEPALILGGLYGLWTLRARWRELFPLPLFVFGTMAIHVISVSQMRYRLPVMPVLILGFCAWACRPKTARS